MSILHFFFFFAKIIFFVSNIYAATVSGGAEGERSLSAGWHELLTRFVTHLAGSKSILLVFY